MKDNYMMLQTKVSPMTFADIKRIEHKKGISNYQLVQMFADTIVRYMDDKHNLSPEMERIMMMFEKTVGWKEALNLADPTAKKEVCEAFYVIQDPTGQRKGFRLVNVQRPWMGEWYENSNVITMLDRFIRLLTPTRAERLDKLRKEFGCTSFLDLLDKLIEFHCDDSDMEEVRKTFEDARRHEFGKNIEYGKPTRRSHHYDIDGKGAQRAFSFNENEKENE